MTVGVSALSLETAEGWKKAGVSRYGLHVIEAMARHSPGDRFEVFVNGRFERPGSWSDLGNVELRVVRRYRTHRYMAGLRSKFQGVDVWFVPSSDALELCPVPQVAMIHDVFPFTNPEWFTPEQVPAMRRSIGRAIRGSRVFVVNSDSTKKALVTAFGVDAASVFVTPLGLGNVATGSGAPVVEESYFLAVGTMEPRKNLGRLLEAWSRVEGEYPETILVLAGAKGWKFSELEGALAALGDRVRVLEYVADEALPGLIRGARFCVMASLDEGFGMPVLEAMAYGAPLVLSNAGALPEVAGDAAVYFDPLAVDGIEASLREGLGADFDRNGLVARGRERAASFSWERTADLTLDVLRQAAGKG